MKQQMTYFILHPGKGLLVDASKLFICCVTNSSVREICSILLYTNKCRKISVNLCGCLSHVIECSNCFRVYFTTWIAVISLGATWRYSQASLILCME